MPKWQGWAVWPGRWLAAVLVPMMLAGCGTLPDAGPLVDASVQLRSAVASAGSATEVELRAAERAAQADDFRAAWAVTDRSVAALVTYAESLSALVQAGRAGGDSVQRLADAGRGLAAGVGLPVPGAAAAGAAVDVAAQVYGHIAAAGAAASLEESLGRMQPAVDRIAGLIVGQLDAAGEILTAASLAQQFDLRTAYRDDLDFRKALERERRALYADGTPDAARVQRLEQIDRLERIVAVRLEPMERELAALRQRERQSAQMMAAARHAVLDWADAHRQLRAAVRESRAVDPRALQASVEELRLLVRRVRDAA
ncbi:MAG: hypothetical protein MUF03_10045 [Rubrivivax sp.]|jgi:hypothetical protein|nr:hypothetical protein [Rubrivivax sp.]